MEKINWEEVTNFAPSEFPEDPDGCAEPELIYRLDHFRDSLPFGCRIYPSPAPGALARRDNEGSAHYANSEIRSRGVDVFCEGEVFHTYLKALRSGLWRGVGLYFDTFYLDRSWFMFHLDIMKRGDRQDTAIWFRDFTGEYKYPDYDEVANLLLSKYLFHYGHIAFFAKRRKTD